MITSWMGQGQDEQALTMARALSRSGEVDKRQQAKQLVAILDAPSLERPDSWTMQLPALEVTASYLNSRSSIQVQAVNASPLEFNRHAT
jgi:hypothetical protein